METIFILVILLLLAAFVIGMLSPKTVKYSGNIVLAFVSLFVLSTIVGASIVSPVEETSVQEKQSLQEVEASIGKPIQVGYFIYTIKSVVFRKTIGDDFLRETADGIYMMVNLSIKNISKETRTLDGSLFAVTDEYGTKYEYSTDASTALELSGKKTLFLKECQPNITTNGILAFEVPQKGEYYLHLIGDFWGTESVRVLLK